MKIEDKIEDKNNEI